jgi:hypothetical protein
MGRPDMYPVKVKTVEQQDLQAMHRTPPEEAGYTYAVEPTVIDRLLANEEESIYGHPDFQIRVLLCAQVV